MRVFNRFTINKCYNEIYSWSMFWPDSDYSSYLVVSILPYSFLSMIMTMNTALHLINVPSGAFNSTHLWSRTFICDVSE